MLKHTKLHRRNNRTNMKEYTTQIKINPPRRTKNNPNKTAKQRQRMMSSEQVRLRRREPRETEEQ